MLPGLPNLSPGGRAPGIDELVKKADAIVLGTVYSKSSQLTDNGKFVFTDYEFVAEEVLKGTSAKAQTTITVTRPGGKILLEGQQVEVRVESFRPLQTGGRYVLFLNEIPSTHAFQAVNQKGSFEVTNGRVEVLTDPSNDEKLGTDLVTFITNVRLAIARGETWRT